MKTRLKTITTRSQEETKSWGKKLVLTCPQFSIICLYGELGAGKTTFAQGAGEALGITKIKSPTYSIMREHSGEKNLNHIDLYRLKNQSEVEALGLNECMDQKNNIVIIEWADRLGENLPRKRLDVVLKDKKNNKRQLTVYAVSPITESDVKKLYFEYATPKHIQNHCGQVTKVAMYIAKKMKKKGIKIDLQNLKISALLHDLLRVCDIQNFHVKTFGKTNSREKKIWLKIREKYGKMGHEEAAYRILKEKGEKTIGEIIRKHKFSTLLSAATAPKTWEEKLLYYSDKRVIHERITTINERLHDGRIRYAKTPEEEKKSRSIESKLLELEREIFKIIGEHPDNLIKKIIDAPRASNPDIFSSNHRKNFM